MATTGLILLITCFSAVAVLPSITRAQCHELVRDEYNTTDADVIIGLMQDFLAPNPDGRSCDFSNPQDQALYYVAKLALQKLPSSITRPPFSIGLERYESCEIPERAAQDATYYASQIFNPVNETTWESACLTSPYRPGMLGPYSSVETFDVAPILSAFDIPLVGHGATHPALSDKTKYGSYLRTIAPDTVQGELMAELLLNFNWTYVNLLYKEGSYGESGAEAFHIAAKPDIEIATKIKFPVEGANYTVILDQILANPDARVVIYWGSPSHVVELLAAIEAYGGAALDLQIVASDFVSSTPDSDLQPYNLAARGMIMIAPGEFNNAALQTYLEGQHEPNPYVPSLIDAVHVFVDAMQRAHEYLCGSTTTYICEAMANYDRNAFLENFMKTANFTGVTGRQIAFNDYGDPLVPAFEIQQYKSDGSGGFNTQKVGVWLGAGTLDLTDPLEFYSSSMPWTAVSSECANLTCPVFVDKPEVFYLGGMFPIHEDDCNVFSDYSNFHRVIAFMWAMNRVNWDPTFLPGIQLKPLLGETCSSPDRAAANAYDLVKTFYRNPDQAFGVRHNVETGQYERFVGMVTTAKDDETVAIDRVLQTFSFAHISDSARLPSLSDKEAYPYFSRMVAPSCSVVSALLEFLQRHNVTYVQTVQSGSQLSTETANEFMERAPEYGICIAQSFVVARATDFTTIGDRMLAKASADVIVNFAEFGYSSELVDALALDGLPGEKLQLINVIAEDLYLLGSDSPSTYVDTVKFAGYLSPIKSFRDHFITFTPETFRSRVPIVNTWFAEYWMNKFSCQLPGDDVPQIYDTNCTGTERLVDDDLPGDVDGIVYAVNAFAHALANLRNSSDCGRWRDCPEQLEISPAEWVEYIRGVAFERQYSTWGIVEFDEEGDSPAIYDIKTFNSNFLYESIGYYYGVGGLTITDPTWEISYHKESTCRGPCRECAIPEKLGGAYFRIPGDLDIPAVLWLSEEGSTHELTCGDVRLNEAMAIEVIHYAISQINEDPRILPGIKLGMTIMDSCGQFLIAARQLSAVLGNTVNLPPTGPVIGVLGPYREYLQGHVASDVTSPLYVPTIGFTPASPSVFQTDGDYPATSLYSTAPSYDTQAIAVADILEDMGWQHVVFVYSHSYYGHAGNTSFHNAAYSRGICVRESIGIDENSPQEVYDDIVRRIRNYRITVVVAFVESRDARALLTAERPFVSGPDKITWVGSDKWFTDPDVDVTDGLEDVARGTLVVTNYRVNLDPLRTFLSNKDLATKGAKSYWLRKYLKHLAGGCGTPECLENIDFGMQARLPPYTATLINAVYVLAQSAHDEIQAVCSGASGAYESYGSPSNSTDPKPICSRFYESTFHDLLYRVRDVYVPSGAGGRPFWFEGRQGPAEYTILNFHDDDTNCQFEPVGEWNNGDLSLNRSSVYLYNTAAEQLISAPEGCPKSCAEVLVAPPGKMWEWGTKFEIWSIVIIVVAAIGAFACFCSVFVFLISCISNQKFMQFSSLILMYLLVLGVLLMYFTAFVYMVSPSPSVCGLRRVLTSFSYAMVYAAIATKAIRACYGARAGTESPSKYSTSKMQLLLYFVFLAGEIILVAEWLILERPDVDTSFTNNGDCNEFQGFICNNSNTSTVISMVYVYVLVAFTFIMSFGSVNHSRFQHEGKFTLLASMFSICLLIAWGCCHILLPEHLQTPAIVIGIVADATMIFFLVILPKVTLMWFDKGDDDDSVSKEKEKHTYENAIAVNEEDVHTPL